MEKVAIEISELRQLTDKLFDLLVGQGVDRIDVKQSHYWKVYFADSFESEPPAPVIGDVWDDLGDVRSEVSDPSDQSGTTPWHAFMHLSGLMNFVAYAAENGDFSKGIAMEKHP